MKIPYELEEKIEKELENVKLTDLKETAKKIK